MFTGNRGNLTFENGRLGTRRWKHQAWIICDLEHPRGRIHELMPERAWTPLFFLDEAVALAAGHRPCAYCRPEAYRTFKSAWCEAHGPAGHAEIDRDLHQTRVGPDRHQIRHRQRAEALPNGSFVLWQGQPQLVWQGQLYAFRRERYGRAQPLPGAVVDVLTPEPCIAALKAGFLPQIHPDLANR